MRSRVPVSNPHALRASGDRWLSGYADIVTLLLAVFASLYAASSTSSAAALVAMASDIARKRFFMSGDAAGRDGLVFGWLRPRGHYGFGSSIRSGVSFLVHGHPEFFQPPFGVLSEFPFPSPSIPSMIL